MKIFSPEEEQQIIEAICKAERKTSGEIRIHLDKHCRKTPYEEAVFWFEKLGMTRTAERNGILFYLAIRDHQFAVIGDEGIHQKVRPDFWEKIRDVLQKDFQEGEFLKGLLNGIHMCGEELAHYFPRQANDSNELPNQISKN